jgi:beta-lactamase regulating signal transducer with metallopeptidase domain
MSILVASTLDSIVILGLALLLTMILRRRSAALRHAILAAALLIAALAPLLEATMPQWSVPWPASTAATVESSGVVFMATALSDAAAVSATPAAALAINWAAVAFALWMAGASIGIAGLLTGLFRLSRITSRCARITSGRWHDIADQIAGDAGVAPITILQSAEPAWLVTFGLVRPKIVLPAGAHAWTDARIRIVLTHELAHIRRRDWATQMIAEAVRIIYWFNPLSWVASRRLRQESEYACDDAVIGGGVAATDYATHLLDVARHAAGHRALWTAAPAIANPSTLERRISAMLNDQRNRDPLTRRSRSFVAAAMLAVAVPVVAMSTGTQPVAVPRAAGSDVSLRAVATAEPAAAAAPGRARIDAPVAAQEKPASITGTLYDPLGGLLPGATVTLTDQVVGVSATAITGRDGSFAFQDLQPATYELTATLPGFATVSSVMPIGPAARLERRIVMPIGSLQETISVGCQFAPAPPSPRARAVLNPGPNRGAPQPTSAVPFSGGIGGQIRAPRQIARANPVCPNHIGVDTVVVLSARVGIDGYLSDIALANRDAKPATEIVDSAIEAVRLWQYTPTLLNGVPVEANIMMTVAYDWQ